MPNREVLLTAPVTAVAKASAAVSSETVWRLGYWLWLMRKVSPPLARLCHRLGLTPNQVTGLSFLSGLAGGALLAAGTAAAAAAGTLLFSLHFLLDDVDGDLARLTGRTSVYGRYLDGLAGHLIKPWLFVAAGLHVYRGSQPPLWSTGPEEGRVLFLVLGWVGAMAVVQRKLVRLRMGSAVGELAGAGGQSVAPVLAHVEATSTDNPPIGAILRRQTIALSGSVFPGLLLAALLGGLDIFVLVTAVALSADVLWYLISAMRRLRRST